MDIRMPDMDGLTMLEKLREEGVTSKAVILSAYSDFSYAKRAMELGVSNYLLKPVKSRSFARSCSKWRKKSGRKTARKRF